MSEPKLVRTSSLHPKYIEDTLSYISTPVKIQIDDSIMSMTKDWNEEENENQRRLVKFSFTLNPPATYNVEFNRIDSKDFTNEVPIISCIYWKEKDIHIVTSVDIILILEYLVQESFNIEEKNRIRRNLQSLRPFTISRANKSNQRFFNLLMSMEDPRPRNIEKDLKVFKWSDFTDAISKVISKYSIKIGNDFSGCENSNSQQYSPATHGGKELTENAMKANILSQGDKSMISRRGQKISSISNTHDAFMPFERLKVIKKKISKANGQNSGEDTKSGSFSHALRPTEPMPISDDCKKYNHQLKKKNEKEFSDAMDVDESGTSQSLSKVSNAENDSKKSSRESLAMSDESTVTADASGGSSVSSESGGNSGSDVYLNGSSSANIFSNGISSVQTSETSEATSVGTFKVRNNIIPNNSIHGGKDSVLDAHHPQYYQYPKYSQLHHKGVASPGDTGSSEFQRRELRPLIPPLPSLSASINSQIISDNDSSKLQLPPIMPHNMIGSIETSNSKNFRPKRTLPSASYRGLNANDSNS